MAENFNEIPQEPTKKDDDINQPGSVEPVPEKEKQFQDYLNSPEFEDEVYKQVDLYKKSKYSHGDGIQEARWAVVNEKLKNLAIKLNNYIQSTKNQLK